MAFFRWSAVYGVMIYSYINDSISKPEVDNSTKKPLAVIKIPLWPGKIPQGNEVKVRIIIIINFFEKVLNMNCLLF